MEQSFILDIKLKRLSCPFNWEMEDVIKSRNRLLESQDNRFDLVVDEEDNFPEFLFVWHLMFAYENSMSNELENAMNSIDEAEVTLDDIKKKETLRNVENVLDHIFVATKCHVLKRLKNLTEVDELLKNIYKLDVTKFDETESAMLNACRCLAWKLYRGPQTLEAINFAMKAVECEPTNGKWYFLLGKSYRQYRRRQQFLNLKPNQDEIRAFQQAYKLSENSLFGASLANLYRESRNYEVANEIYKKIYDHQPTSCTVRLQLALGFIRARKYVLAKQCLDYVAERLPNSITYAHYMGIYEEKCNKDLKAALSYYQIAVDKSNYGAEWQYLDCKKQLEPDWDPLPHLLEVLKKYEKDSAHNIQEINIQIGMYYLFQKHDILSACVCLAKAIEIQPNARTLRSHRLLFGQRVQVNIYHVLEKEIQFALQGSTINLDEDTVDVLKNTQKLCVKYSKDLPSESDKYLPGSVRSQSLNRFQNRGQGFCRGRNSREYRSNSISISRSSADYSPTRIKNEPQELSSQSTASCSSWRNGLGKYKPRFQKRDNDSPERPSAQTTESSPMELYRPPHTFRNQKTPAFGNRVQRDSFSKSLYKSESVEDATGCLLVKVKNPKL